MLRKQAKYRWPYGTNNFVVHPEHVLAAAKNRGVITEQEYKDALAGRNDLLAELAYEEAAFIGTPEDYGPYGFGSSDIHPLVKGLERNYNRLKKRSSERHSSDFPKPTEDRSNAMANGMAQIQRGMKRFHLVEIMGRSRTKENRDSTIMSMIMPVEFDNGYPVEVEFILTIDEMGRKVYGDVALHGSSGGYTAVQVRANGDVPEMADAMLKAAMDALKKLYRTQKFSSEVSSLQNFTYEELVRIGKENKALRPHIRPILAAVQKSGYRDPVGATHEHLMDAIDTLNAWMEEIDDPRRGDSRAPRKWVSAVGHIHDLIMDANAALMRLKKPHMY